MEKTWCKWKDGNEPCEHCPRKISALHMCKLLQDEQRLEAGQHETIVNCGCKYQKYLEAQDSDGTKAV